MTKLTKIIRATIKSAISASPVINGVECARLLPRGGSIFAGCNSRRGYKILIDLPEEIINDFDKCMDEVWDAKWDTCKSVKLENPIQFSYIEDSIDNFGNYIANETRWKSTKDVVVRESAYGIHITVDMNGCYRDEKEEGQGHFGIHTLLIRRNNIRYCARDIIHYRDIQRRRKEGKITDITGAKALAE